MILQINVTMLEVARIGCLIIATLSLIGMGYFARKIIKNKKEKKDNCKKKEL